MESNHKTPVDQRLKIGACSPCRCPFCEFVAAGGDKKLDPVTGRRLHICHFKNCVKIFDAVYHLKRHIKSHTGERPFACKWPGCEKKFAENYNLKAHVLVHTGEKVQRDYSKKFNKSINIECPCSFCQLYNSQGEKVVDSTGTRVHNCHYENCGKIFKYSSELAEHFRTHTGELPEICERQKNSNTHMKIHTGEKNHECDTCGRKYFRKSNLSKHIETHDPNRIHKRTKVECSCSNCQNVDAGGEKVVDSAGRRLHTCQYENCEKSFNSPSNLAIHQRSHTGERPFICEWEGCDKKFHSKSMMETHVRKHSLEKIYKCDACGHECSKKSDLLEHIVSTHKVSSKDESYYCNLCFHRCFKRSDFVQHLDKNHKAGKRKSYKKCSCPNCQTEEVDGNIIVDSSGKRLHNCHFEKCDKVFHFPYDLVIHLKNHNLELPCACGCLGYYKKFFQYNNLPPFYDQYQSENPKKSYSDIGVMKEMHEVKIEPNREPQKFDLTRQFFNRQKQPIFASQKKRLEEKSEFNHQWLEDLQKYGFDEIES